MSYYYNGTFEEFMKEFMFWAYIIGIFLFELLWVFFDGVRR